MLISLAKLITIGLALFLVWLFVYDYENLDIEGWLICIAFSLGLFLNYAALSSKENSFKILDLNVWPFLLFKRLTLQEQIKIEKLKKND